MEWTFKGTHTCHLDMASSACAQSLRWSAFLNGCACGPSLFFLFAQLPSGSLRMSSAFHVWKQWRPNGLCGVGLQCYGMTEIPLLVRMGFRVINTTRNSYRTATCFWHETWFLGQNFAAPGLTTRYWMREMFPHENCPRVRTIDCPPATGLVPQSLSLFLPLCAFVFYRHPLLFFEGWFSLVPVQYVGLL